MTKTLVLYSLRCQKSENRFLYNLKYFIDNGGIIDNKNIDYLIIVNSDEKPKIDLPKKVKLLLKPNFGHGWGGWYEGLQTVNIKDYEYFCVIKDIFIGPFMYEWMDKNWITYLKNLITERTQLITNNIPISITRKTIVPRVNAGFMFFTNKVLNLLIDNNFFTDKCPFRKKDKILCKILLKKEKINIKALDQININIDYVNLRKINLKDKKFENIIKFINEYKNDNIYSMIFVNIRNNKRFKNLKDKIDNINNIKKKINEINSL